MASVATLGALFWWVYARTIGNLYFLLDDFIETEVALRTSWVRAVGDSFSGVISWSGYRPVAYSVRATLAHLLGLEHMWGYYLFGMALLFASTLLTFHLVRTVGRSDLWATVAAAVVLLLPSHNEAVFYMSANANLLALFSSLLTLEAARRAILSPRRQWLWSIAAAATFAVAILSYEVTLPLPLLIAAAHWGLALGTSGGPETIGLRRTWGLYAGLAAVAVGTLLLRFWAGGGLMIPDRSDYGVTLEPAHLVEGYRSLLGQLVLLKSSPWMHLAPNADLRQWSPVSSPGSIVAILIATCGMLVVFALALRSRREARGCRPQVSAYWLAWGVAWVVLLMLPFAALAGRNPENRYTTILSFGYGVAIAAAAALAAGPLGRNSPQARARQVTSFAAVTALIAFFAYTSVSDAGEWSRASAHTRAFMQQAALRTPELPPRTGLLQVGVPGHEGGAYLFTTAEGFGSAMYMLYGRVEPVVSSDLWLRAILADMSTLTRSLIGLGYNRSTHEARVLDSVWACGTTCVGAPLMQPEGGDGTPPWLYAQVYNDMTPEVAGLGMLFSLDEAGRVAAIESCWGFLDTQEVLLEPSTLNEETLAARCRLTGSTLINSGALYQLTSPVAP